MTNLTVTPHRPGVYRIDLNAHRFAQFVRGRYTHRTKTFIPDAEGGGWWKVELREREGDELVSYAGVFRSLRFAAAETYNAYVSDAGGEVTITVRRTIAA